MMESNHRLPFPPDVRAGSTSPIFRNDSGMMAENMIFIIMKLSLLKILEAFSIHSLDRVDERLSLSPLEKKELATQVTKQLVNWNRDILFRLPKQFFTPKYLPDTIWMTVESTSGKKGMAIMGIRTQLSVITVLSMDMIDPETMTPLKKNGEPVEGMSFNQFNKYLKFLMADPTKSKPTWQEFKAGKREPSRISFSTSRGSGRY